MARIKDTFFSPFRAISPTNSPKSKSAAATTLSFDAETSGSSRVLFSPGIAPEAEMRKGALPAKRKSSKRTPSRKPSSMSMQLDKPPMPPVSSIPKLDLNNIFSAPTSKAPSPRKDGSSSGRSSTNSPRTGGSTSARSAPAAGPEATPVVTPRQVAFSAAPVLDIAGNVVAVAPIPLPLTVQEIQFPPVPPQASVMATPLSGAPRSSSSGSPSRFASKPPVAPQSQEDASRNKILSSAAKKREAPVSLQSPAKRRRLSLSSSKSGTTRSVVLSSPGKAANLFGQATKDFGSSGLGEESLPEIDSPSEKIITHTRTYSCDREITDKERKKAAKTDSATMRDRSATLVPMDVDYDASLANVRPRSGSASSRSEISPRSMVVQEAEKFTQGTMKEIIEWMILSNESAAAADSFIMAYSHFKQTSADLFTAIFDMYQRVNNDINQKRRIVSFLSRWLDNQYSTDFLANGAAVGTVSTAQYARLRELMNQDGFDFGSSADGTSSGSANSASSSGISGKNSISKGSRRSSLGGSGRMSILRRGTISASATNKFEFMNMNHQELATQLTVIEYTMLRSVNMNEFKNQAWNKADKETKAPNIHALISHFNKMSFWVATEIVTSDQIKEQVKRITKFIKLAGYLRDAGNLNAVMEVISGLNSLPVQRLRSAWRAVPSKHISALKKMEDLMAPSQNFLKYRQELKVGTSTMGFVVPYIGVHLGDLVHIAEGYLDPEDGKYDLAKILKLGEVLIEIRKFQTQIPAAAMPNEDMTYTLWLHGLKPLAPEVLEKPSLEHKKRELEAQK
eukprot:TRINITY_DN14027_c0_g1_i1.p1 TRINITY_DN14027_c0_g1~~TRINITY_DN14027_c0_g1_i1.p1  ORF type:complete len:882 (+),score=178.56 TRINITY_DN14027_c0_g1_i1:264-2648(+)